MADSHPAGRIDYRLADLRGVSFAGKNLEGADFRAADAQGADFTGANLRYADFRGANVQGAIFRNATLYGAKLQGAEAYSADLRGADLRQANLAGAYLHGAQFPPPEKRPLPSPGELADAKQLFEPENWEDRFTRSRMSDSQDGDNANGGSDRLKQRSLPDEQRDKGRGR